MGKRMWGIVVGCAITAGVAGCATGGLNAPDSVPNGPVISTSGTPVTSAAVESSPAAAQAQAARAAASSAAASSKAAAQSAAQRAADKAAAEAAADKAAAESSAAQEAAAEQAAADQAAADQAAADQAAAEQAAADEAAAEAAATQSATADDGDPQDPVSAEDEALANGWYDERGWVSPQTAARALAAGFAPGDNVPGYLRCGTICGEEPTSGEIQAQQSAEQESAQSEATSTDEPCAYVVVRGVCYATPEEAAAAGD